MAPGQKAGVLCRSSCGNRLVSLSEASSRSPRRGNGRRPAACADPCVENGWLA